jgi:hypothetical protein
MKTQWTGRAQGRMIKRSFAEASLDRVRAYHATTAYQKAMRKRKVWPEPLFGEAKQWHGLRQFRLRGLANVTMEGLLIAAGQTLKRWLVATGWGRRYAPAGSVAVSLPAVGSACCFRWTQARSTSSCPGPQSHPDYSIPLC